MPIVIPNPFAVKIEKDSCILNEFLLDGIKPFISYITNLLFKLLPNYDLMCDSDFLAFSLKFENDNHSTLHDDESHLTVSIPLNENFVGGEFVFENKYSFKIEVPQKPYHAIVFPGSIPHYTKHTKGTRYNLNIYLKQKSCKKLFYNEDYINYLFLMGLKNYQNSNNGSNIIFRLPRLPKPEVYNDLKVHESSKHLQNHSFFNKYPTFLIIEILKFLNNKDIFNIEYTCKNFKSISHKFWKQKYTNETKSNLKFHSTDYKSMYLSKRIITKNSEKKIITLHINDSLGEKYLKYMTEIFSMKNHVLSKNNLPVDLLYDNAQDQPGYFIPRSLFIQTSQPSEFLKNNADSNNLFYMNSLNLANTYDTGYESNLEEFFDRLRKISESVYQPQFMVTCDTSALNVGLSTLILENFTSNYSTSKVFLCPLIIDYDINSAILLKNWAQEYPIFQYELPAIYQNIDKIYKNQNILYKPETLLARALYGLSEININFSDLIPFPKIHLLQHSFSPVVKSNLTLGEITYEAVISQLFNSRESEKVNTCAMYLNFFGDILTKDIMAVVGCLKTKRNINFVDWSPTGFKCGASYAKEFMIGEIINRSVHCIANTYDSHLLYSKLCGIKKCEFNIKNLEIDDVSDFLMSMVDDYKELYDSNEVDEE